MGEWNLAVVFHYELNKPNAPWSLGARVSPHFQNKPDHRAT